MSTDVDLVNAEMEEPIVQHLETLDVTGNKFRVREIGKVIPRGGDHDDFGSSRRDERLHNGKSKSRWRACGRYHQNEFPIMFVLVETGFAGEVHKQDRFRLRLCFDVAQGSQEHVAHDVGLQYRILDARLWKIG